MQEQLAVELRTTRGKRRARRLRGRGQLPAVLYGQGSEAVSLCVPADRMAAVIRHGAKLVELRGAVEGNALVRDVQWDAFATQVLHVDFLRVAADQRIDVSVPVEIRGEAPGVKEGGILEQLLREVDIDVLATAIPEKLHVNVNDLHLNGSITADAIEDMPAEARLRTDSRAVIVHCVVPAEVSEEVAVAEGLEPERIGGRADESAEEGED
jgi:large subunit ribosomal protein L25